eukprot:5338327-Lingulodinium_polyedra.AAC.1
MGPGRVPRTPTAMVATLSCNAMGAGHVALLRPARSPGSDADAVHCSTRVDPGLGWPLAGLT